MTVTNASSTLIRNIEVDYPGGSYGIPKLEPAGENHHKEGIDAAKACKFTVKFEDASGHSLGGQELNLGDSCPLKVSMQVDSHWAVSAVPGK